MIVRNGEYIYVDGTIASTDDLQSVYISRSKKGIVFQYMNGHRIDICYESSVVCDRAWITIKRDLSDKIEDKTLFEIHKAMIVRVDQIRHIEFDEIDYRFAILYKTGECFVFDFASKTITFALFHLLMQRYFGIKDCKTNASRHRADFWQHITGVIRGEVNGETPVNLDYWTKLDNALVNAANKPSQ